MSLILDNCVEYYDNRKICVASERGKTYRLNNLSGFTIRKVKIDKCLAQKEGEKRCDYVMNAERGELLKVFFIELKGCRQNDAIRQLYSTILYLKAEFIGYCIHARIIGSRDVPDISNTPNYRRLAREILPTKGIIERATNKIYSENI